MYTWGRIVAARARWVLVGAVVLVAAAAAFGLGVFDRLSQGGFDDPAIFDVCATATSAGVFSRVEVALAALGS